MRVPRRAVIVAAAVSALALGVGSSGSGTAARDGGTLRVVHGGPGAAFRLDPALPGSGWGLMWDSVCATLTAFRDAPAPRGLQVVPEAAVGPPDVSRDGRTYVFTVKRGLRFSDGSPLTADNFARALGRLRDPVMRSPGGGLFSDVRRVSTRGQLRLVIELSKPRSDLPVRLTSGYACPVPLGFPIDPAGVSLTVGSGPYYVTRNDGKQLVVERNSHYRGTRPHHVDRMVLTLGADLDENIRAVAEGRADVLATEIPGELRGELARRFGVNEGQLFRTTGVAIRALVLNTSRPLFRGNSALRKAINFALDRPAIMRAGGSAPVSLALTDQLLTRWIPGRVDHDLYPLEGPNLRRARELARGNVRGGKAILWTSLNPDSLSQAEVVVHNLREIGLEVEVEQLANEVINARAGVPGAPYDIGLGSWPLSYPDPAHVIFRLLGGANARKPSDNGNTAYFDVPAYNRRMASANRLVGPARYRAYAELDADIMRNEAPWAPLWEGSTWLLVSKGVGCLKMHPVYRLDIAAICLR